MRGTGTFAPRAAADAGDERGERLVDAVLAGVQYRDVVVPRTAIPGKLRLLKRSEESLVRAEVRRELAKTHGLASTTPGILEAFHEWREERILRTLAIAVRDPDNPARALATIDEWAECDDMQLLALWTTYQDFEAELDPLGANGAGLTPVEVEELKAAAGKGDVAVLMSFGSHKLALFGISTAAPPPS